MHWAAVDMKVSLPLNYQQVGAKPEFVAPRTSSFSVGWCSFKMVDISRQRFDLEVEEAASNLCADYEGMRWLVDQALIQLM